MILTEKVNHIIQLTIKQGQKLYRFAFSGLRVELLERERERKKE